MKSLTLALRQFLPSISTKLGRGTSFIFYIHRWNQFFVQG